MRFYKQNSRTPEADDWKNIMRGIGLDKVVSDAAAKTKLGKLERQRLFREVRDKGDKNISQTLLNQAVVKKGYSLKEEAVVAGTLIQLANDAPQALNQLLNLGYDFLSLFKRSIDPLSDYDPQTQLAVLSPIGLIDLFREYFYEFETFLGPPVEHVWVSPGGSLELYEIHTKKIVQERQVEIAKETTSKSETEVVDEDELSSAIGEENSRNTNFGISVSGSGKIAGVVEVGAEANFGMTFNTQTSQENAHKHSRRQSEKISSEIRRSFKSTFRTSVETEDTSSRRYVLQNTTDKLVNYELRRKMRQVGVQVQHLSTQLCWQSYVDNPGISLGISNLVHVAKPDDYLSDVQPPEALTQLPDKKTTYSFVFPFSPLDEEAQDDGEEEDYDMWPPNPLPGETIFGGIDKRENGLDDPTPEERSNPIGRIEWRVEINGEPPGGTVGYKLTGANIVAATGTTPDEDPPEFTPRFNFENMDPNKCMLEFTHLNFNDNAGINFTLDLIWEAPEPTPEAIAKAKKQEEEFEALKKRLAHAEVVKILHERIKMASNIQIRPPKDLREEERAIIFRQLIGELTGIKSGPEPHLMSELIRAIFDVEKMLYFVAPEWWTPREHRPVPFSQQLGTFQGTSSSGTAGSASQPGWGVGSWWKGNQASQTGWGVGSWWKGNQASQPGWGSGPWWQAGKDQQKDDVHAPSQILTDDDKVNWGGEGQGRPNYLITEDSEPARMGSSLGWLLQLDGDTHRNAFLNSPWVKAVIPIRPGKELAALNWLRLAHVEGEEGLKAKYAGPADDLDLDPNATIEDAIKALANKIKALGEDFSNILQTETVFEKGFDPLAEGFVGKGIPFEVFSQWIEVLPTEQVVAVEYKVQE
jgi:hypothetical protein